VQSYMAYCKTRSGMPVDHETWIRTAEKDLQPLNTDWPVMRLAGLRAMEADKENGYNPEWSLPW